MHNFTKYPNDTLCLIDNYLAVNRCLYNDCNMLCNRKNAFIPVAHIVYTTCNQTTSRLLSLRNQICQQRFSQFCHCYPNLAIGGLHAQTPKLGGKPPWLGGPKAHSPHDMFIHAGFEAHGNRTSPHHRVGLLRSPRQR